MNSYPWKGDEKMRSSLELAGWRYARMIGIVRPEDENETNLKESDLAKYPHYIKKTESGQNIWKWEDSIQFVHDLTGYEKNICEAWLDFDWG